STRLNWFSPRCPVITGGGPQDPPLPPPPASMPRSALPIASPLPPRSRSSSHLLLPTPPLPTLSGPRVETFIRCPTARGGYHNHGSSLPSITGSGGPLEHEGHQRGDGGDQSLPGAMRTVLKLVGESLSLPFAGIGDDLLLGDVRRAFTSAASPLCLVSAQIIPSGIAVMGRA